jgi:ribosomal 50S subunit-recycling heat shock protein
MTDQKENSLSNNLNAEDDSLTEHDIIDLDTNLTDEQTEELAGQHLRFRVGTNLKFARLDKYLCGRFSCFSRTRLQKLIKEQGVNVNGRPAKPSHKLQPADEVDLILPAREVRELVPEDIAGSAGTGARRHPDRCAL